MTPTDKSDDKTTEQDHSTTSEGSSVATPKEAPALSHVDPTYPTGNTINVTEEGTGTVTDPNGQELYPPTYAPIPDVPDPPATRSKEK